ncbi:MAG: phytoene/squalene synthase family protein [Cytophagales bacterium]|nr:phytoene/squalene synthase family protein [Cytophagales bacterium]
MDELFNTTALKCSRLITQHYSTSFTLGIKTLHKKFHLPVYAVYGFVRYADEIVDTFHGKNKQELLLRFKADTYRAIEEEISLNPVLHAFQMVVNEYGIDHDLIEAFLYSMEMDLDQTLHDQESYEKYIYGSAEVVGLMCLRIFCEGNRKQYNELLSSAKSLGSAFQKVNFLRDIKSDFDDRGRVYFPGVDFNQFTLEDKKLIEEDIEKDFRDALEGIKMLPQGARGGVYLAYVYYFQLFKKIKRLPPRKILSERVRVPDSIKMLLWTKSYVKSSLNTI